MRGLRASLNLERLVVPTTDPRGQLRCRFWCKGRTLGIRWSDHSDAPQGVRSTSSFERALPLDFQPTAFTPVGERYVLVAGRADDGRTLIQSFELAVPSVLGAGARRRLEPGPCAIAFARTVYSGMEVGRDLVHVLFRNRGRPGTALVQFFDSRDWYELDWAQWPFELRPVLEARRHPELGVRCSTSSWPGNTGSSGTSTCSVARSKEGALACS